ncbi:MAG: HIT family protein [Candidatus Poseidonia sp.]|nr:HIT family protein [Poseidonia sp.]
MKKDIGANRLVMATLFEKILSGDIPSHRVAKGEGWYAFLDIFPRREGHTLVIPNRGVQRLADLTPTEHTQLMEGVIRVQYVLGQRFGTTDFTVCVHDGPLAGQEVPHVHIHVLPRTENDGGSTLVAMWPRTEHGESNHEALASLAASLQEVK